MISDEIKEQCIAEAKGGASAKDLANKYGVSTKAIYTWTPDIKRRRGGNHKKQAKKPSGFIEFRATYTHLEARLELKDGTKVYVPISALKEAISALGGQS